MPEMAIAQVFVSRADVRSRIWTAVALVTGVAAVVVYAWLIEHPT